MGNLNALRDWGHARDYVKMQWLMLQQPAPKDYVIATEKQTTVKSFIQWAAMAVGIELEFRGSGANEEGFVKRVNGHAKDHLEVGQRIITVNPKYFRPAEVETLLGDASKAREELGWVPEISAEQMCVEMVEADLKVARKNLVLRQHREN